MRNTASFLLGEAERLHEIGGKLPDLAISFEDYIRASSKSILESLWRFKVEQMRDKTKRDYGVNPALLISDIIAPVVLRGVDIEHPGGGSSEEVYRRVRGLEVKAVLSKVVELVDFLDYEDLLAYLCFFTRYPIDSAVEFGDGLARGSGVKHKTRMDGTPLPAYPLTVPNWTPLPYLTWTPLSDILGKEDEKEKDESKKPKNIF